MKIAIFTDTYLPKIDGVGISTEQFCRLLAVRGHQFMICAPEYGPGQENAGTAPGISAIRFPNRPLPSYPEVKVAGLSLRRIREAMGWKPDLVHIQTPGLLGQYGIAAARLYSVPVVGTYHTMVNEVGMYLSPYRLLRLDRLVEKVKGTFSRELSTELRKAEKSPAKSLSNRIILRMTNELYNRCEVVISPTELIANELRNGGVKRPLEVVSNGLDLEQFRGREIAPPEGGAVRYVHVGRLSFEKNVDIVLWAFLRIRREQPAATLDILGDGPALPSLRAEATRLGLDGAVQFHGFVDRQRLPEYYPKYHCFLTASTMETQGLVVLEALASGLPAIGVEAYALPELIHHGENGFLARPFDDEGIALLALDATGDPARFAGFSARSLEIAAGHDVHVSTGRLEQIYRNAATGAYRPGSTPPGPNLPEETPPEFPEFPDQDPR